jgi:hypothetical protein
MARLEQRVAKLEQATQVDLNSLTDDELRAYAAKFPMHSSERLTANIVLVNRHPSTLPIVYNDPEPK